jgi:Tol biopolymer transport system component
MQLTRDTGLTIDPALSPDGKLLAYASDRSGNGNLDIWVRQVGGGEPTRVTQDPANEREPTFSPDGTMIAFRSDTEGSGRGYLTDGTIYVVSSLGGSPPRKIASAGQRPRFSPDGTQIAYWSGEFGGGAAAFFMRGFCRIFVVATAGGAPRQLRADFVGAAYPVWAPDGQHVLFLGNRIEKPVHEESIDWWVTPLDQGPAIATDAVKATREEKLSGPSIGYRWALSPSVWDARSNTLVFSAGSGDSTNLWRIGVSARTWKATGRPERLTSSSAIEQDPSMVSVADGTVRVAFASRGESSDIWSLPIEAETGRVTGDAHPLTRDSAADLLPSLSADGRKLVFISTRSGRPEIWIKDLTTGEDTALTASRGEKFTPIFSPDGKSVSFVDQGILYLTPSAGGAAEMIGEDGGIVTDWSSDGKYLFGNTEDHRLFLIDVASRRRIELLPIKGRWFASRRFSKDGRWIWFAEDASPLRLLKAPFQGETMAPESTWLEFPEFSAYKSAWSPDETLSYDISNRDGFNCVWAQRVDPLTKRPVAPPIPIYHSHEVRLEIGSVCIGRDRMIFTLAERTGNIWMAEWKGGW